MRLYIYIYIIYVCMLHRFLQLVRLIVQNYLQFGNHAKVNSLIPDIALRISKFRETFESEVRK